MSQLRLVNCQFDDSNKRLIFGGDCKWDRNQSFIPRQIWWLHLQATITSNSQIQKVIQAGFFPPQNSYSPWKVTLPQGKDMKSERIISQPPLFRDYVKLWGGVGGSIPWSNEMLVTGSLMGADRWAGQLIEVFCDGTVGAVDEGTTNTGGARVPHCDVELCWMQWQVFQGLLGSKIPFPQTNMTSWDVAIRSA